MRFYNFCPRGFVFRIRLSIFYLYSDNIIIVVNFELWELGEEKNGEKVNNKFSFDEISIELACRMANVPLLTLNNGMKMPFFGLGTYLV